MAPKKIEKLWRMMAIF